MPSQSLHRTTASYGKRWRRMRNRYDLLPVTGFGIKSPGIAESCLSRADRRTLDLDFWGDFGLLSPFLRHAPRGSHS